IEEVSDWGNQRLTGIRIDDDVVRCDVAVVAMGPWSVLAEDWFQGFRVPLLGTLGSMAFYDRPAGSIHSAIAISQQDDEGRDVMVTARADGKVTCLGVQGGHKVLTGQDLRQLNPEDVLPVQEDLEAGRNAFERLSSLTRGEAPASIGAGVRSVMTNRAPMIGRIPGYGGTAYVACGHNAYGILCGPITGKALAEVRQLQLLKGRLEYRLEEGQGPSSGWVSVALAGKELVVRAEEAPEESGDEEWEVVGGTNPDGIIVRLRQLELCEGRLCFELLSGEGPRRGWVSLRAAGRELVRRRREPEEGATEPLLNTDYMGTLRGACRGCQRCNLWRFTSLSSIEWGGPDTTTTIDDRRHAYDRKMRGYQEKRRGFSARCQNCRCPAEEHLDLSGWLCAVQKAARPFRETYEEAIRKDPAYRHLGRAVGSAKTRTLPRHATIPAAALEWPVFDAAIYLLSLGFFDPRLHGRTGQGDQGLRDAPGKHLVSVVCPTSEKRHNFHPLLYENFRTQSYEPKELIVVDTGSRPSPFLLDKVQSDSRVIYRHFTVDDSRDTDPMSAVLVNDGLSLVTAEDVKRRRGICFKPKTGWSLGFKRNLCGHLARGVVIAHFDDDDLYAPDYLSRMVEALFSAFGGQLVVAPALKAAATLSEWHMMEVKEQQFGFFDPKTDPLVEAPMRESFQYGYGFSLVYTKSAWETVPFPDVEWSEDGEFMGRLQLQKIPIQLVCSRDCHDGLAAHTHHSDSTSGGEMCGNVRLGYAVPVPDAFRALLPVARKVALDTNVRRGSQHPLRAEMHRVLDGFGQAPSEVRWHEKELFLKRNPDFGQRPPATPQYKEWSGQVRGGFGFGLSYRGPWLRVS
ncbi:unnamed protein product, partial [Symbiodinium necroappetens]